MEKHCAISQAINFRIQFPDDEINLNLLTDPTSLLHLGTNSGLPTLQETNPGNLSTGFFKPKLDETTSTHRTPFPLSVPVFVLLQPYFHASRKNTVITFFYWPGCPGAELRKKKKHSDNKVLRLSI